MFIDFLTNRFTNNIDKDAIIWKDKNYSYKWLNDHLNNFRHFFDLNQIKKGTVVSLRGDFDPNSIALLLALVQKACIIVP